MCTRNGVERIERYSGIWVEYLSVRQLFGSRKPVVGLADVKGWDDVASTGNLILGPFHGRITLSTPSFLL
jgi:hypothetical protein